MHSPLALINRSEGRKGSGASREASGLNPHHTHPPPLFLQILFNICKNLAKVRRRCSTHLTNSGYHVRQPWFFYACTFLRPGGAQLYKTFRGKSVGRLLAVLKRPATHLWVFSTS